MKLAVIDALTAKFGNPSRQRVKIISWDLSPNVGIVVQLDQPNRDHAAYVWLPYPAEGQLVPEVALEYPGEAGRHSGTYSTSGLKKGLPALRLTIRSSDEILSVVDYIEAMRANATLPAVNLGSLQKGESSEAQKADFVRIDLTLMPTPAPIKARREAIPRTVQREVWQRDGGRCVECQTREKLCFDHIVPFSRGGGNSVRNIQLLCEPCNLSKSNRI